MGARVWAGSRRRNLPEYGQGHLPVCEVRAASSGAGSEPLAGVHDESRLPRCAVRSAPAGTPGVRPPGSSAESSSAGTGSALRPRHTPDVGRWFDVRAIVARMTIRRGRPTVRYNCPPAVRSVGADLGRSGGARAPARRPGRRGVPRGTRSLARRGESVSVYPLCEMHHHTESGAHPHRAPPPLATGRHPRPTATT